MFARNSPFGPVGRLGGLLGPAEFLLRLFLPRDVIGDALEEEGLASLVAHHLGLAVNPDDPAVASQEAVLGTESFAEGAGEGKFEETAIPVVGVEPGAPEYRILEPFLLGEAQQRLDLGADVQLVDAPIELGQEGDDRHLLDQRAVTRFCEAQLRLHLLGFSGAVIPPPREAGGRRGLGGINRARNARQALKYLLGRLIG